MNPANLVVYTKTGCPWCNALIEFLDDKGIEYEEREVRNNPKFFEEMKAKSGQEKAPTVDIGGHIMADTDKDEVERYLREKEMLA